MHKETMYLSVTGDEIILYKDTKIKDEGDSWYLPQRLEEVYKNGNGCAEPKEAKTRLLRTVYVDDDTEVDIYLIKAEKNRLREDEQKAFTSDEIKKMICRDDYWRESVHLSALMLWVSVIEAPRERCLVWKENENGNGGEGLFQNADGSWYTMIKTGDVCRKSPVFESEVYAYVSNLAEPWEFNEIFMNGCTLQIRQLKGAGTIKSVVRIPPDLFTTDEND